MHTLLGLNTCLQIQIQIQNILVTQVKPATNCDNATPLLSLLDLRRTEIKLS